MLSKSQILKEPQFFKIFQRIYDQLIWKKKHVITLTRKLLTQTRLNLILNN